jgi:hypothetical protein
MKKKRKPKKKIGISRALLAALVLAACIPPADAAEKEAPFQHFRNRERKCL